MSYGAQLRQAASQLGAWSDLPFFASGSFDRICTALDAETSAILPAADRAFAALEAVAPEEVRAVILGQDPYPTPGHANGLAFSVEPGVTPLPGSLRNILRELRDDTGATRANGDLSGWASQGVLLVNTALTVRAGAARSHAALGWQPLIEQVIARAAAREGIVWLLWGRDAQKRRAAIEAGAGRDRLVIESAHPSPLSAHAGFLGSRPFSRTNRHLTDLGRTAIRWDA